MEDNFSENEALSCNYRARRGKDVDEFTFW